MDLKTSELTQRKETRKKKKTEHQVYDSTQSQSCRCRAKKKILKHVIFLHEMWLAVIDVVLLYDCRSHSVASCLLQEAVVKYIMKNTWTMLILDKRSCGFYSLR